MDSEQPPPPPPPPLPVKKSGLSTGCVVALVLGIIFAVIVVVLGIIAALSIPAAKAVLSKAQILQAKAGAQSLVIGLKGYDTEYNRMPVTGDESSALQSEGAWLEALLGNNTELNQRRLQFLELKTAKRGSGGLISSGSTRSFVDPWGNPYRVIVDMNKDGKLDDPEHSGANLPNSVAAWSAGPDGDYDTWSDNVMSWK